MGGGWVASALPRGAGPFAPWGPMDDKRDSVALREEFERLKADLLRRLETVTAHLSPAERDALAEEMTRLRLRHEYRGVLGRPS